MNGPTTPTHQSSSDYAEVDPTGRYGRYDEVLGKGSSKTVFRAFDEYNGMEVAWNKVKLRDFLQSPQDLERLYCELHLLKTLKHKNIMKMYASWVDASSRNVNFITEMFTSGTLRQYMLRHKKVNIRAVKHWCRQILRGLHYLHSQDPPVIHRDLKCDNIFINGNCGEVKIGDFGLATFLRKSYADHCVGTPEFMAPEVYNEEYNELVDIYSFGMCVLEMVTLEYPYGECTTPAQIYKKVTLGKKPDAFYMVKDPEVQNFVDKCLAMVSSRLSARELLEDPFLQTVEHQSNSILVECQRGFRGLGVIPRQPLDDNHFTIGFSGFGRNHAGIVSEGEAGFDYPIREIEPSVIELGEDENMDKVGISIKGQRNEDGEIFLRLRIVDKQERTQNIYFSFNIESDTALGVATEMVAELDLLSEYDERNIAKMIDGEIAALIPQQFEAITYHLQDGFEHEVMDDTPRAKFSSSGHRENHLDDEHDDVNLGNLEEDKGETCVEKLTTFDTVINFDSSGGPSGFRKDDENGSDITCSTPYVYDSETYELYGQGRCFPKVGVLKNQGYEQKVRSRSFFSCLARTRSIRVEDVDLWSQYNDILHRCF